MGGLADDPEFAVCGLPGNDLDAAVAFVRERKGKLSPEDWSILFRKQHDPKALQERLKAEGLLAKP